MSQKSIYEHYVHTTRVPVILISKDITQVPHMRDPDTRKLHPTLSIKRHNHELVFRGVVQTPPHKYNTDFDPGFEPEHSEYNLSIHGGAMVTRRKIYHLQDLESQDLVAFYRNFATLRAEAKWTDEEANEVLHSITSLEYLCLYDACISTDQRLEAILKAKYNHTRTSLCFSELSNIKQNTFTTIKDYKEALEITVSKIAFCRDMNDSEKLNLIEQKFIEGLGQATLFRTREKHLYQMTEIYDHIHRMEEDMIQHAILKAQESLVEETTVENWKRKHNRHAAKHSHPSNYSGNYSRPQHSSSRQAPRHNSYVNRNAQTRDKWCDFHQSSGHSNDQCFKQQQNHPTSYSSDANSSSRQPQNTYSRGPKRYSNSQNSNPRSGVNNVNVKEKPKLFALKEPMTNQTTPTLTFKTGNDVTGTLLVDTGANYSFISKSFQEKVSLETHDLESRTISFANKETTTITKQVKISFKIENDLNNLYEHTLLVLDTSSYDIILGMDFLIAHNSVIDINNRILNLSGQHYELPHIGQTFEKQDKLLTHRIKCNSVQPAPSEERSKQQIELLVKEMKLCNPKLGTIAGFNHSINTTSSIPITMRPYNIPIAKIPESEKTIRKMLEDNVIQESLSPYAHACIPIFKQNGSIRLVIDFRKLNQNTLTEQFPLPKISDILAQLSGSKFFSQFDMNSGYYQIPLTDDSTHKTAFIFNGKKYEFLRIPFGLKNAPYSFQQSLSHIFRKLDFVKIYLDDILVHSNSLQDHHNHLQQFFKTIQEARISINYEKSHICKQQVLYLGHHISHSGATINTEKIDEILNFTPKTRKQLMKLNGFLNYFRSSIINARKE
eukprot:GAHX01000774.1.p1 GENE.GAHX01000774.1~~GAHX01000774.1.p1  ORF type:complete len:852 (+),score=96.50 GAHX01000774.1:49-2556(+)